MRTPTRLLAGIALVGAITSLAITSSASARSSIVYDNQDAAEAIFTGPNPLTPARGGLRQDPGPGGVFQPNDGPHRLTKVNGKELATMSTSQMVSTLRSAIDAEVYAGGSSGLVGVDEIGNFFRDPKFRTTYKLVNVRGKKIRIASHNSIQITKNGYRVIVRAQTPPIPGPAHPGRRLSEAMRILDEMPYPGGGSYAERVQFYMAPAFVTSIAEGRGPHFTLGRVGGKSIRPGWRGVMPALARGQVWLEMYHGSRAPVAKKVWQRTPQRLAPYLRKHGGTGADQLHFLISGTTTAPPGMSGCGSPMACQWAAAESTAVGRQVLANGPGAYRVGDQAAEWLREFNRRF